MKSYETIAQELFERRKEYLAAKKKRQKVIYYSVTSFCVIAVLLVGVLLPKTAKEPFTTPLPSDTSYITSNPSSSPSASVDVNTSTPVPSTNSSQTQSEQQPGSVGSYPSELTNSSTNSEDRLEEQGSVSTVPPENSTTDPSESSTGSRPQTPTIDYRCTFGDLEELSDFLTQLNIKVETEQQQGAIPEIITPAPKENFWATKNESVPPDSGFEGDAGTEVEPGAPGTPPEWSDEPEAPGDSPGDPGAPPEYNEETVWQSAVEMFDNGLYSVPYLQNGNQYFQLAQILVEKTTIRYTYVFNKFIPDAQFTDCLNVQLYKDSFKRTFEEYLLCYDYLKFTYNGITYTVFRMDESNLYDACIMWEQNGFYCRANYVGPDQYLSTIIPNLYLIQLPW